MSITTESNNYWDPFNLVQMEAELNVEALRANLRIDGRKKGDMREIHFEKESTYRADGSATVSHGILF